MSGSRRIFYLNCKGSRFNFSPSADRELPTRPDEEIFDRLCLSISFGANFARHIDRRTKSAKPALLFATCLLFFVTQLSFTALAAPSGGDGGAGSGGFGGVGGVGGAGSGSGGGAGANGDAGNFTAGGGGGGGAPRGTGGTGGEGAGGISGGGPGANGANAAANQSSGGGGGGGNGGGNGLTTATPQTISSPVAGGAGQNGGAGGSSTAGGVDGGGGGGGGAAGDGLDITAGGTFTNSSTVRGGDGGSGGNGGNGNPAPLVTPTYSSGGNGGNGGDAGVGVNVTSTGATLINNGTIAGGNGGGGGTGGTGLFDPGTGDGGSGTNGTAGAGGIGIKGAGLTIINSGSITGGTSGDGSTQADAIEFTDTSALAGTLEITGTSSINGNVVDTGGTYNFVLGGTTNGSFNTALIGTQYQDAGNFQLDAESATTVWTLSGTNAYTGPVEITQGILNVTAGTLNSASAVTFNGGTLQAGGTFALSNTVQVTSAGGTIDAAGQLLTLNGDITDGTGGSPGALTFTSSGGVGIILLGGNNAYSAASVVQGNTSLIANSSGGFSAGSDYTIDGGGFLEINGFNSTIRSLSGAGTVADDSPTSATLTIALPNGTQTFSGTIVDDVGSDNGVLSLAKTGGGTQVLSGENTYSGPTDVDAGTLEVDGSIASSRVTDVASGGTLTGTGWVGATTINAGGTFAPGTIGTPGSSMTVNGNLTLAASSTYQIYLNPTTSLANVNGTASLGGTVQASFANGSYISKTYTILTTTGGVSGTFSGVTNVSLPTNFTDKLAYDSKNAYLDLTLNYEPPPPPQPLAGLNQNQFNVATTLANYFNTNGGIPTKFGALPGAALSQIDGEGNTGAERPAIQLESEFLNAMLDPFADGRFGDQGAANSGVGGTAQPLGYTAEELFTSRAVASAYSGFLKEPPTFYVPHWTALGWRLWWGKQLGRQCRDGLPSAECQHVRLCRWHGLSCLG